MLLSGWFFEGVRSSGPIQSDRRMPNVPASKMESILSMDWKIGFDSAFSDVFSKRNMSLLLLCWLGGLAILVAYGTVCGGLGPVGCVSPAGLPTPTGNETGTLVARRNKGKAAALPAYKVTFENLVAENGSSGCCRTSSDKVVHMENLSVSFFYPAVTGDSDEQGSLPLGDFCTLFAPHDRRDTRQSALGLFEDLQDTRGPWSLSTDLTNTKEVRIKHLDWRIHRGDATVFAARCMRASLQAGSPYILLRGHATVTVAGATLESSCIKLDARDGRLTLNDGTALCAEWVTTASKNTILTELAGRTQWLEAWFEGIIGAGHSTITSGRPARWGNHCGTWVAVTGERADRVARSVRLGPSRPPGTLPTVNPHAWHLAPYKAGVTGEGAIDCHDDAAYAAISAGWNGQEGLDFLEMATWKNGFWSLAWQTPLGLVAEPARDKPEAVFLANSVGHDDAFAMDPLCLWALESAPRQPGAWKTPPEHRAGEVLSGF